MSKNTDKGLVLFDIDGVLGDFESQWKEWKKQRGLPLESKKYYRPSDRSWAQLHDRFAEHGFFLSMSAFEDSLDVMYQLAARGYATGCFTARQSFTGNQSLEQVIFEHTRDWLKRVQVPHPKNTFFCGRSLKKDLIVQLNARAMVEDHLETAQDISLLNGQHGRPILSFLLDRAWNRHGEYEHRIYDIRDMLLHLP